MKPGPTALTHCHRAHHYYNRGRFIGRSFAVTDPPVLNGKLRDVLISSIIHEVSPEYSVDDNLYTTAKLLFLFEIPAISQLFFRKDFFHNLQLPVIYEDFGRNVSLELFAHNLI